MRKLAEVNAPSTATAQSAVVMPARSLAAPGAAAAGLLLLVIGTFLPWLRSGQVARNSYEAAGALQRLLATQGFVHTVMSAWPFVSLACAAAIALYALGLHIAAALVAVGASACAAAVAIAALSLAGSRIASPATLGPLVTLIGSCLIGCAVIIRLVTFTQHARSQP